MPLCRVFSFFLLMSTCSYITVAHAAAIKTVTQEDEEITIDSAVSATGETNYLQSDGLDFTALIESDGSISVVDGSAIYLNGVKPMEGIISNGGKISVTGQGWGVYANPYQTLSTTATVANAGTLERIQLAETNKSSVVNDSGGTISGSVLMGTNGVITNYGTFSNKENDAATNGVSNLISFEKNGTLVNGLVVDYNTEGEMEDATFYTDATVNTDHISFANAGVLLNAATVNNQSITMLNDGNLYNVADPYNSTNAGTIDESGPSIVTLALKMGDNANIKGDQGSNTTFFTMELGDKAQLNFGTEYFLTYEKEQTTTDDTDSSTEIISPYHKIATLNVGTGTVGNDATVNLLNGAQLNAETLSFGSGATVTGSGAAITMQQTLIDTNGTLSGVTPSLTFGDRGTVNLSSWYRPVTESVEGKLFQGQLTSDLLTFKNNGTINLTGANVDAGTINFGDYGKLTGTYFQYTLSELTDTETDDDNTMLDTDKAYSSIKSTLGSAFSELNLSTDSQNQIMDNIIAAYQSGDSDTATSIIETLLKQTKEYAGKSDDEMDEITESVWNEAKNGLDSIASESGSGSVVTDDTTIFVPSKVTVTNSINFRDYGSVVANAGMIITAPQATFKNNGTIENYGGFNVDKLIMGDFSTIKTYAEMTSDVQVGSNSYAYLLNDSDECEGFGACRGGSITGGFQKADGAENVYIISASDYSHYGYLANRINVDKITVQQNMLELNDVEVNGLIEIGTDAWLKLSGDKAYIYDPITRVNNATNTTVEVALDDGVYFTTRNTVEADHVLVSGGGFEVTRPINVGDIMLDSNTTVRVTGNYAVGDLVEKDGNAVNTTFSVKAGTGNVVDSSGRIDLDRVDVESGIFNAYHDIVAVNDSVVVSDIDGVELGNDSVMNVYSTVETGRIVRQQDALAAKEKVENTAMNVVGGSVMVHKNGDLDTLTLDKGRFVFLNDLGTNAINVTNNVSVGMGSVLAGAGVLNIKNGELAVNNGAHAGVSVKPVDEQALTRLVVTKQNQTITDTTGSTRTNTADVTFNKGAFLDVRASGTSSDIFDVDGTLTLNDGTRLIVRNPELDTSYDIATGTTLNVNPDALSYSFLWDDVTISENSNTLSVSIGNIQTLREGIADTPHSKNVDAMADALTQVRELVGHYAVEDFLDNVFYADTAVNAVATMNEYAPEGYLNSQTVALRTMSGFRQNAVDALDNFRTQPVNERRLVRRGQSGNNIRQRPPVRQIRRSAPRRAVRGGSVFNNYTPTPYYPPVQGGYSGQVMYQNAYTPMVYGRAGGDSYRNYVQRRPRFNKRKQVRTDRGGLWLNPFISRVTQDDKDNMNGYDYDSYGLMVGADRKFGSLALGITGMVAEGELKQTSFKSDVSSYGLGVYGSYQPRSTARFVDFYALWAMNANKGTRQINSLAQTMKADYDVTATAVGAALGYDFAITPNLTITPRLGIDYTRVSSDEIQEEGNTSLLVQLTPTDLTSIKTPLELKAAMRFGDSYNQLMPEVHARWTHEFGDLAPEAQATFTKYQVPFAVNGIETDRDNFTLGGSLQWLTGSSELSLRYDLDFSSTSSGHTLNAGYKYVF